MRLLLSHPPQLREFVAQLWLQLLQVQQVQQELLQVRCLVVMQKLRAHGSWRSTLC